MGSTEELLLLLPAKGICPLRAWEWEEPAPSPSLLEGRTGARRQQQQPAPPEVPGEREEQPPHHQQQEEWRGRGGTAARRREGSPEMAAAAAASGALLLLLLNGSGSSALGWRLLALLLPVARPPHGVAQGAGLADNVVWAVNAGGEAHVNVHGIHFRKDPLRTGGAK